MAVVSFVLHALATCPLGKHTRFVKLLSLLQQRTRMSQHWVLFCLQLAVGLSATVCAPPDVRVEKSGVEEAEALTTTMPVSMGFSANVVPSSSSPTPATVVYSCGFDNGYPCLWFNKEGADDFDWITHRASSITSGTRPSFDHTFRTRTGSYAYIEGGSPNQPGDKAYLAIQKISSTGPHCLSFYHHMYGVDVGALNVYIMTDVMHKVWSLSGEQGDQWMPAEIKIQPTEPFQVIFEGVLGSGNQSDIAIDDIRILRGACALYFCSFDRGHPCLWYNEEGSDDFDWTIHSGSTHSFGTGPSFDNTFGTRTGIYAYIEGSAPSQPGYKARLLTEKISSTGPHCLSFYYHMYGVDIGALNVYITTDVMHKVWSLSGEQGNRWMRAVIALQPTQPFQVEFEGVRGSDYQSDIAIDDISILRGQCGGQPGVGR